MLKVASKKDIVLNQEEIVSKKDIVSKKEIVSKKDIVLNQEEIISTKEVELKKEVVLNQEEIENQILKVDFTIFNFDVTEFFKSYLIQYIIYPLLKYSISTYTYINNLYEINDTNSDTCDIMLLNKKCYKCIECPNLNKYNNELIDCNILYEYKIKQNNNENIIYILNNDIKDFEDINNCIIDFLLNKINTHKKKIQLHHACIIQKQENNKEDIIIHDDITNEIKKFILYFDNLEKLFTKNIIKLPKEFNNITNYQIILYVYINDSTDITELKFNITNI